MTECTHWCVVCAAYMRFKPSFGDSAEEEKPEVEVKDVFWSIAAPLKKKKSHQETIHLFTYARLRQMLNNSSSEADNMQLYLGYMGVHGFSPLPGFMQPKL